MIEPAVDRRRGFTAVMVHLRSGSPPSPDGLVYNRLAGGEPAVEARYPTRRKILEALDRRRGRQRPELRRLGRREVPSQMGKQRQRPITTE